MTQDETRREFGGASYPVPYHCKILTVEHFFYIVCVMSSRDYLGEFEHIVVLALLRLGDRTYGVTVRQEIELRIGREVSIGAIYATLGRLETKGYVNSSVLRGTECNLCFQEFSRYAKMAAVIPTPTTANL